MKWDRHAALSWLTLFLSSGTLICCALPILLVMLGLGAVVSTVVAQLPFLITLTRYKAWLFLSSALLLVIAGWFVVRPAKSCPIDPKLNRQCERMKVWNRWVWGLALVLWLIGFFTSYLLLPLVKTF